MRVRLNPIHRHYLVRAVIYNADLTKRLLDTYFINPKIINIHHYHHHCHR